MKKKAFIATLISTFSVVGLIFVLVFTTIKDNYSNTVNYSGETITISRVENGQVKNSSVAKTKSHAVGAADLNIPEISMDKKKVPTRLANGESGANQVILTPSPNYNVSNGNKNTALVPNSTSEGASRRVSNSGNAAPMYSVALLDNSKDIVKSTSSGFVSTTSDLTSPKTMANQKFNAGGSPPPSEKETPSLPIGDGWYFLILLAAVYVGLRKWLI